MRYSSDEESKGLNRSQNQNDSFIGPNLNETLNMSGRSEQINNRNQFIVKEMLSGLNLGNTPAQELLENTFSAIAESLNVGHENTSTSIILHHSIGGKTKMKTINKN